MTAEIEGTSVVEVAASFAVRSGGVVQTAGAHSGAGVARLWVEWVDVVVAFAFAAHAVRLVRISPVCRGALVTSLACISFQAVANNSVEEVVFSASVSKLSVASWSVGAHAWFALVVASQKRVAVVTFLAHFAVGSDSVAGTDEAGTGILVAHVGVTVAVALGAVREPEVTWFALVASSSGHTTSAGALTVDFIAEVVAGALRITVAWSAAGRTESICSRGTSITSSSDDIRFAHALATPVVADCTFTALQVAVARLCSVMND